MARDKVAGQMDAKFRDGFFFPRAGATMMRRFRAAKSTGFHKDFQWFRPRAGHSAARFLFSTSAGHGQSLRKPLVLPRIFKVFA